MHHRLAYLQRAEGGVMKVTQKDTVVWCVENASKSLKLSQVSVDSAKQEVNMLLITMKPSDLLRKTPKVIRQAGALE